MLRRFFPLTLLALSVAAGRDPAKLNVIVTDLPNGKSFSFEIQNLMGEDITRYEVGVDHAGALVCGVTVDVKSPKDLRTPAVCALTSDPPYPELKWKARIVFVEFANGFTWKPKE